MAGRAPALAPRLPAAGRRVAIVASRFHEDICGRLVEGARGALLGHGIRAGDVRVVWVPGAFELPQAAARLAAGGAVDALVCVGCVIRGETPHFDYVAGQAASGIAQAGMQTGIPVVFGVVTTDTVEQAINRSGVKSGNKGYEAAMSAVEIVNLYSEMAGRESEDKGKGQDKVFPHVV